MKRQRNLKKMKQSRNVMISCLQVFGILLVVAGHSFHGCPDNPIRNWIYSFHMPLFMFLSGYLLDVSTRNKALSLSSIPLFGTNGFIPGKIKRLLIPYVVISSLVFFPKAMMNSLSLHPVDMSLMGYCRMLLYPWDNVIIFFWFLPTLFLIFCIVLSAARVAKFAGIKIPCSIVLLALILLHLFNPLKGYMLLNLGGVVSFLVYFVAGFLFSAQKIELKLPQNAVVTLGITFLLSVLFLFIPAFLGKNLLTAFNGILMSVSLAQLYVKYDWRFFHSLFGASYAIYLFSWFPQVLSQQVFLGLTHAPWQLGSCLAVLSGVYIPLWIYKWIIRNKNKKVGKLVALLTGQ